MSLTTTIDPTAEPVLVPTSGAAPGSVATSPASPAVTLRGVTKTFDPAQGPVIEDMSLEVAKGELVAVLVEAPLESLVGHPRVTLDAATNLLARDRLAVARQEQGDQRQPADLLVGVLRKSLLAGRAVAAHGRASVSS